MEEKLKAVEFENEYLKKDAEIWNVSFETRVDQKEWEIVSLKEEIKECWEKIKTLENEISTLSLSERVDENSLTFC